MGCVRHPAGGVRIGPVVFGTRHCLQCPAGGAVPTFRQQIEPPYGVSNISYLHTGVPYRDGTTLNDKQTKLSQI